MSDRAAKQARRKRKLQQRQRLDFPETFGINEAGIRFMLGMEDTVHADDGTKATPEERQELREFLWWLATEGAAHPAWPSTGPAT